MERKLNDGKLRLNDSEIKAIRLWRLADECKDQGHLAESIRVCNAYGKAYPWKRAEQRYAMTTEREWWRDAVWAT